MTNEAIIEQYKKFTSIEKIARQYVYEDSARAKNIGYKPCNMKNARLYVETTILNYLKTGGG